MRTLKNNLHTIQFTHLKGVKSVVFSILTVLYNLQHNFRTFLSPPKKKSLYPLADPCIHAPHYLLQPQATTLLSVPMDLPILVLFFIPFPTHEVPSSLSRKCKKIPADSVRNLEWNFSVCFCAPRSPYWSCRALGAGEEQLPGPSSSSRPGLPE